MPRQGNPGIIVIAATNRADVLDAALLRPGRFDRRIVVDLPDFTGRLAILGVHSRGKPLEADVDLAQVPAPPRTAPPPESRHTRTCPRSSGQQSQEPLYAKNRQQSENRMCAVRPVFPTVAFALG